MKLTKLEKALEETLVKMLAARLQLTEASLEELVVAPKNRWLRGGTAAARIARKDPSEYIACVEVILPCAECQERGGTFRRCHNVREASAHVLGIVPEDVPAAFHRDVGEDAVEVLSWEW